ncbi:MAG TPA: SPASM domain-containing protein, partial [Methanobacterium sp.]|nr:SPASM domain-containing protein [Methanobacterium sp.]
NVYVNIFDASLVSWVNYPPSVCLFAPQCGTAMIIEHNGDVYSCDHFVDSEHLLGNIMETPLKKLVDSSKQIQFGLDKSNKLSKQCTTCDYRFACWGACPKHRFVKTSADEKEDINYLCPSYKKFFKEIDWPMTIMAALYKQGKAPADIMAIMNKDNTHLQEIFPEIGRNDPCPCKSGLKFKKCHGKNS